MSPTCQPIAAPKRRKPGRKPMPKGVLSRAEDRLFALVAAGLSDKEIAHEAGVTVLSVAALKNRLKKKLGVTGTVRLALLWHGVDPGEALAFARTLGRPA